MAPKRAAPRTETVNRQNNKGYQDKKGGLPQEIDQPNRRRNTQPPQTIDLTSSDLSSEISQIDTPRSFDRTSSTASLIELSPPSKRRRLASEVDYSSNFHQNPDIRGGRKDRAVGSDLPPSSFEAGPGSSNRRKTGSCNSKRQRGKGYVGGSSSDHSFVTDSNQPTATTDGSNCLSRTALSRPVTMPANLEDLPSTSKVSTRGDISSRSHEPSGTFVEASGSSSTATGHWFRSFTCFANSADGEQTALDLSDATSAVFNVEKGLVCVEFFALSERA
ncbi:unnamed protein product [Rodentolepis nana]|uniref:Uncharacterized protein n=1 Tax=Rodentolepis nana TaxID=102285 RepID=A0A0R3TWN4_RODNA|nr:unnamed protein product [Rodentolepis nana]VDO12592.1 unnamed protein product [Rodentolepis nana]